MNKKIALLIGISEYNNVRNLAPCQRDIELMHAIISESNKYEDILVLKNNPQSLEAKDKISSFIRENQKENIEEVFIYYTGHGTRHKDDFLYLFSDFDNQKIEQTSLRNSEFDTMLKSLNPQLTIKVVDACQAGTEYIKSNRDLQLIFEKSSSESFKKTYFLFSSSSSESSIALADYSVFTKSFAQSLLRFEGQDIRFRDVMAYISDDPNVKRHQTPLFILQADNTETFCNVSETLTEIIKSQLLIARSAKDEITLNSDNSMLEPELTEKEKLILLIKSKSHAYCNEEEGQLALSQLIDKLTNYSWSPLITQLYNVEITRSDKIPPLESVKNIAKWLSESTESYFVRILYSDEEYETKEKIEIEEIPIYDLMSRRKRIEYQPITKYRKVLSAYDLTAPSPSKSVHVSLCPQEQILPWIKVFFCFVFSKSKLVLFFKYEIENEASWSHRTLTDANTWKINQCKLKNHDLLEQMVANTYQDIENDIFEIIKSKADTD